MKYRFLLFFLAFCAVSVCAQQSTSKSKAKDKLYEKEGDRDLQIVNLSRINSPNLDFSPAFYQNGLVYVTSRHKAGAIDKNINETFFELFYAELDGAGNPAKPQQFSVNINSQAHEGPVAFSREGDVIYFTRSNMENGITKADSKGVNRLKIYEAKRGPFDWEEVTEMRFNSDEYSVMHPSLSADGKTLYFSSDMPGGLGGFDIYKVSRVKNRWSEPVNLGATVNTEKNEVFPFIHDGGTLFFSTAGHPGHGGLDIFMCDLSNENSAGAVINLGEPFNSPGDDLSFILNEAGDTGYFSSERSDGKGKDDIYRFTVPSGLNGLGKKAQINTRFIVFDETTEARIPDAEIRILEQAADGFLAGNEAYAVDLQPAAEGATELVMKLRRKDAAAIGSPDVRTNADGESVQRLEAGKRYLILASKDGYRSGELMTSGDLKSGSDLRIALSPAACRDVSGTVSAQNVGVANAEISIRNQATGKTEKVRTDAKGFYSVCLPSDYIYDLTVTAPGRQFSGQKIDLKDGTFDPSVSFSAVENAPAVSLTAEPIRTGSVIVLENLYYDFNKSAIRRGEARELEGLADIMRENPTMTIDLVAHTDSRGTAKYNMELSMRRAQSAKEFLVLRGIADNRINAFGYGENQLRNRCADGVDCSDAEHEFNRRTEVKVTAY